MSRRSAPLVAALVALLVASVVGTGAASVQDLDQQLQEAQQRADQAQAELDGISVEASRARDELVSIENRLADAEGRLRTLGGQVQLAEEELDARTDVAEEAAAEAVAAAEQLEVVQAELAAQQGVLADQVADAWIHGPTTRPALVYELLRSSDQVADLAADLFTLETVLATQSGTVTTVEGLQSEQTVAVDEARSKRIAADRLREDAADAVALVQGLRDQAAVVRAEVQQDRDRQATVLASLQEDAAQQRAVLASVEAEQDRIEAERQAVVAAEEERRREQEQRRQQQDLEASSGGAEGGEPRATPSGPCPVDGARDGRDFTNDWGYPRPGGRSHEGTDIFETRGTPVRSVGNGTVKEVRYTDTGLGGLYVSIWVSPSEHWYYAHLDSIVGGLAPGVPVSDGQQIGTVGNSGNARTTPPHLHIGHYFDDVAENPYPILARRCP